MTTKEQKTPAGETSESNTTILTAETEVVNQEKPSFLSKKTSIEDRHMIVYKVIKHYIEIHSTTPIAKELILTWNEQWCSPRFTPDEIDSIIAFYIYSMPEETQQLNTKSMPKSQKLFDLIVKDKSLKVFHDQHKTAYATIKNDNNKTNVPINSAEFHNYVRHQLYKSSGESVSEVQLKEALSLLTARALYENEEHSLFHRVAQIDNSFYYDLMNKDGEVVKINEDGWTIIRHDQSPLLFKSGTGKEQARPERGGDIKGILELVNIKDPREQMIYLSTLPVRLIRDIDQAVMYIHGSAGSGKSTLLKMTKDLLDPSNGGISMPINKIEDAGALLNQTWVFANDNISKINDEMSDFLCVVATGAESSRRKLYTDADISVLTFKNPIYITGVNVEAYKSDLLSRTILLKTNTVGEGKRVTSGELNAKFEQMKPYLLGSLFDILSQAMNVKKKLEPRVDFRMADFALWGAACAEVIGYGAKDFQKALNDGVKSRAYDAIYSLSAGRALIEYLDEHGSFEGTVTDLFKKLRSEHSQEWHEPIANSPASLGKKLRELENSLDEIGILLNFKARTGNERRIEITKKEAKSNVSECIRITRETTDDSNNRTF